jgi:hypothetical protein
MKFWKSIFWNWWKEGEGSWEVSLLFVVFGSEVLMAKLGPARDLRCLAGLRSLWTPREHVLQSRNVAAI